jgi:hypothetical protein
MNILSGALPDDPGNRFGTFDLRHVADPFEKVKPYPA